MVPRLCRKIVQCSTVHKHGTKFFSKPTHLCSIVLRHVVAQNSCLAPLPRSADLAAEAINRSVMERRSDVGRDRMATDCEQRNGG